MYKSKFSALNFSQFGEHKRGSWPEPYFQSYLIKSVYPDLSNIPVGHELPNSVLKGKIYSKMSKIFYYIINNINYPEMRNKKLEDNDKWFNITHINFVKKLISSKNSFVNNYFEIEFINNVILTKNTHYLIKLTTLEILIRLIKNGWNKDIEI